MGEHGTDAEAASYCQCGHVEAAHEHYRRGTDCGICGRDACPAFQAAPATSSAQTSTDGSVVATGPGSQSA